MKTLLIIVLSILAIHKSKANNYLPANLIPNTKSEISYHHILTVDSIFIDSNIAKNATS